MKWTDLKVGEIYAVNPPEVGGFIYPLILHFTKRPKDNCNHFINHLGEYKYTHCCSDDSEFREATQEEKDWLNMCMILGRTVPKPEVVKSYQIF